MRHSLGHVANWIRGLFGQPKIEHPEIPPPPVKNATDPDEDESLTEMGESLERLSWRQEQLRRERRILRRGKE